MYWPFKTVYYSIVKLNDNSNDLVEISEFPGNYGIFDLVIEPRYDKTRSCANYKISRVKGNNGNIQVIILSKGIQDDSLDIVWNSEGKPQMRYNPHPKNEIKQDSFTEY